MIHQQESKSSRIASRRLQRVGGKGFSLIEVALALAVAGFSMIVVLGLLQTGLVSEKATIGQTVASGIVSSVYADLAGTPLEENISKTLGISLDPVNTSLPQSLFFTESGKPTGAVGAQPTEKSRYRASISVVPGAEPSPTVVRILVTWPALASSNPALWPVTTTDSVEVLTVLDRN